MLEPSRIPLLNAELNNPTTTNQLPLKRSSTQDRNSKIAKNISMPLSEDEKRRIEEEERYRAEVRSRESESRPVFVEKKKRGCLPVLLVVMFVLMAIQCARMSATSNPTPSKPEKPRYRFSAAMDASPKGLAIKNTDIDDFSNCKVGLNGGFTGSDYETETGRIQKGKSVTIPFPNFASDDGTRFNLLKTKINRISLCCYNMQNEADCQVTSF